MRAATVLLLLLGSCDYSFRTAGFLRHGEYPIAGAGAALALGDVTGDGRTDLVAAYLGGDKSRVTVYAGDGQAGFAMKDSFELNLGGRAALALGDLGGAGRPQVLVSDTELVGGNILRLLSTDPDGKLSAAGKVLLDEQPRGVAAADVDGDGKIDLLLGGATGVAVRRNQGGGAYADGGSVSLDGLLALTATDIDGDGRPDAVVLAGGGDRVSLLFNPGPAAGGFSAARRVDVQTGAAAVALAAGDIDRDGQPDLALARRDARNVLILLGRGGGAFGPGGSYDLATLPAAVALGPLRADRKPDLVIASKDSSSVSVLLNASQP